MYYLRSINTIFLIVLFPFLTFGTTWSEAYPYVQKIDGQQVRIKAISYSPYIQSPTLGLTSVYFKGKLLYSLKKYYREQIFTSNDGVYLAVVHTSNSAGMSSHVSFGSEEIDYNESAIEIFKNGQPFKFFTLKDVIDTSKILNNAGLFYWGYSLNFKIFEDAIWNCKYWTKELSKDEKKDCKNGSDTSFSCNEWLSGCDSMKLFEMEKSIFYNSIYVENNCLYILTNQNTVVRVDFNLMTIEKIPFQDVVPQKRNFDHPKLRRKYTTVTLPDKFDEPRLKDGRDLDSAVADLFGCSLNDKNGTIFLIFINDLVIDINGKCIGFVGEFNDQINSNKNIENDMTSKLEQWLKRQTFETKLIPKGFDCYSFFCIIHLTHK